jgi:TonB family protein
MRALIVSALSLAVLLPSFGQTAVNAGTGLPTDPHELLAAAAPFYDFSSPEMKPWYLKAIYQFYDLKGNPTEQGTWEYWWASSKVHRSSWTRTGAEHTEWSTAEGALYRKDSGNSLRYFERTIARTLLFPMPGRGFLDSGRIKLDLKMLPPGKPELACVLTTLPRFEDGKLQDQSSGMASYYCFDPVTRVLRMTYSNQWTTQFSRLVKLQGRYLARQVVVTEGKKNLFTVSVQAIDALNTDDAMFTPPADAILEQKAPRPRWDSQDAVATGSLIKKDPPVYPFESKILREQGVVMLGAVIGTDGRVRDLEVLASPSSRLAESAVECVKKWEYKPYLLNGQAVEVETIVNVIYLLGN